MSRNLKLLAIGLSQFLLVTPHTLANQDRTLSIAAQKQVLLSPDTTYELPKRRVTSAVYLGVDSSELVVTSENVDPGISFFRVGQEAPLKTIKSTQEYRSGTYAPEVEAYSENGDFFVTVGGPSLPVVHFSQKTRHPSQVLKGHPFKKALGASKREQNAYIVKTLVIPENQNLLTIATTGEVIFWRRERNQQKFIASAPSYLVAKDPWRPSSYNTFEEDVSAASLNQNGSELAVGLDSGEVYLYDISAIQSGTNVLPQAQLDSKLDGRVNALASHARIGWVAAIDEEDPSQTAMPNVSYVLLLDKKFKETHRFVSGIGSSVTTLLATNPNYVVAVASSPESSIRVWSVRAQKVLATARVARDPDSHYLSSSNGPYDPINAALITPDHKYLVTGTDGGNLTAWQLPQLKVVQTTRAGTQIRTLAVSPDGNKLFSGAHMGNGFEFDLAQFLAQ